MYFNVITIDDDTSLSINYISLPFLLFFSNHICGCIIEDKDGKSVP